jgi:hypothetical protein
MLKFLIYISRDNKTFYQLFPAKIVKTLSLVYDFSASQLSAKFEMSLLNTILYLRWQITDEITSVDEIIELKIDQISIEKKLQSIVEYLYSLVIIQIIWKVGYKFIYKKNIIQYIMGIVRYLRTGEIHLNHA